MGYLAVTFLLFLVRLLFPSVTRTTAAADEASPVVEVADGRLVLVGEAALRSLSVVGSLCRTGVRSYRLYADMFFRAV